jgi:hypothetical protein
LHSKNLVLQLVAGWAILWVKLTRLYVRICIDNSTEGYIKVDWKASSYLSGEILKYKLYTTV